MRTARTLIILALLSVCANAQFRDRVYPRYNTWKTTALTAAAETITVQNPATGWKNVVFKAVNVYCSVACTFHIETNGTAATATTLTVNTLPNAPTATAVAFSASNVGSGSQSTPEINVSAANTQLVDLTGYQLDAASQNLTIKTNSITGTVSITIVWEEY